MTVNWFEITFLVGYNDNRQGTGNSIFFFLLFWNPGSIYYTLCSKHYTVQPEHSLWVSGHYTVHSSGCSRTTTCLHPTAETTCAATNRRMQMNRESREEGGGRKEVLDTLMWVESWTNEHRWRHREERGRERWIKENLSRMWAAVSQLWVPRIFLPTTTWPLAHKQTHSGQGNIHCPH